MEIKKWNESAPSEQYFQELFRVSKNQIIWGANYYANFLPITNSWIFWDKSSDVLKMNTSEGELAWTSFNIPMRKILIPWSGGRKGIETGIKCIHPCQRPKALYKWLLKNYCEEGFKILDTHVGSASSLIVFEELGFDYVGFELDPDYYQKSLERIETFRNQLSIKF